MDKQAGISNVKGWLNENPPVVKKNPNGSEYIPIGLVEEDLDHLESWGTSEFNHKFIDISGRWFCSASALLTIKLKRGASEPFSDGIETINQVGAVTFGLAEMGDNIDFAGTALSFCITNAAKKLGKRLGRALNGRLEKGEASLPVTQTSGNGEDIMTVEYQKAKSEVEAAKWREDAVAAMNKHGFKFHVELKKLAEQKPLKPNF